MLTTSFFVALLAFVPSVAAECPGEGVYVGPCDPEGGGDTDCSSESGLYYEGDQLAGYSQSQDPCPCCGAVTYDFCFRVLGIGVIGYNTGTTGPRVGPFC